MHKEDDVVKILICLIILHCLYNVLIDMEGQNNLRKKIRLWTQQHLILVEVR